MTIPLGYAEATILMRGGGLPFGAATTIGLDIGASSETPDEIAERVWNAFATVMSSLSDDNEMYEVRVKFGPDNLGPTGVYVNTSIGGDTSAQATPNVAYLVRKNTAAGGRPNRGRMYLPGVAEAAVDPTGLIESAKLAQLQTNVDSFGADLATGLLTPVVLHSEDSPVALPTVITSLTVDGRAATQRRRMRR